MLLIDGVRYDEWTPATEDEFEQIVKGHAEDIFGEQSIYLDIKPKLKSKSGIGSIPDGYVVVFGDSPCWHVVEVELSSHPLYKHIIQQISKFANGIKNFNTQKEIVNAICEEIDRDDFLKLKVRKAIEPTETYRFLADLVSKAPVVTIIIEKHTEQLDEAISALAHSQIRVVEFRTFAREGVGLGVHAHQFEPLGISPPEGGGKASKAGGKVKKGRKFIYQANGVEKSASEILHENLTSLPKAIQDKITYADMEGHEGSRTWSRYLAEAQHQGYLKEWVQVEA